MVGLGVVTFYPVIRFRAAFGLGFFMFVFVSQGQPVATLAAIAGSVGLYFATVIVDLIPVSVASALGVLGLGGVSYFLLSA
jgi:hypothetical protein